MNTTDTPFYTEFQPTEGLPRPARIAATVRWILLEYPEFHDQDTWSRAEYEDEAEGVEYESTLDLTRKLHTCGTAGCVAGWAVAVDGFLGNTAESEDDNWIAEGSEGDNWIAEGAAILKLTYDLAEILFWYGNGRGGLIDALGVIADLHIARQGTNLEGEPIDQGTLEEALEIREGTLREVLPLDR